MIDLLSVLLAAALGFVLQRSSMCTVANIERLIVQRRADGLLGLGVAVCWAGVVLLGLAWIRPETVRLPVEHVMSWLLIAGGLVMGIGSALNGGCFVGSIVRIGSGNLNFLATLLGIGLGLRLMESIMPRLTMGDAEAVRDAGAGSVAYAAAWTAFLVIGVSTVVTAWRRTGYPSTDTARRVAAPAGVVGNGRPGGSHVRAQSRLDLRDRRRVSGAR